MKNLTKTFPNKTTNVLLFFLFYMIGLVEIIDEFLTLLGGGIMEKNSDNRISIKINGEEHHFRDKRKHLNTAIEDGLKEVAVSNDISENDEFQWVLPTEETTKMQHHNMKSIEEFVNLKQKKKKGKGMSFLYKQNQILHKGILLSIFLAILIGLGFGVFILKFISNETAYQQNITPPSSELTSTSPNTKEDTSTPGALDDNQEVAEKATYQFQPFTVYVVQAGVFSSTIEVAKQSQEAKRIEDMSFPLAFIEKDKIYLLIGIGLSLDEMKSLGSYYSDSGIETYSKSFEIDGKTIEVKNQAVANNLDLTRKVYEQLLAMTSNAIAEKQVSTEQLNELHENFKKIQFEILAEDSHLKHYSSNVNQAYQAFEGYQKNHNRGQLFQAQQALLNVLKEYITL